MDKSADFFGDVLKLGLGILLGGLLLWGAVEYRTNYQLMQLEKQLRAETQKQTQLAEQRRKDRQQQHRWSQQQQYEKEQARNAARRADIEAEERKQAAWNRYFKPAPECLMAASVECGNVHIRARREFERLYAAEQS